MSTIERQIEALVNWMDEMASRALDEGLRIGTVEKGIGSPWQRLADLDVITSSSAERLSAARDTRNDLGHAYPPESWRALYVTVDIVLGELDDYVALLYDWAVRNHILPAPSEPDRP
ncbi:MAG: hypothetical protein ACRDK4_04445 [Solirubrobacteraceae bacterium]